MAPIIEQGSKTSLDSATKPTTDDEKCAISTTGSSLHYRDQYPEVNEQKLVRKIDFRVVTFVFVANFLTFLDRVNISNAALFGLKQDLKLKGNQFNTALLIYFVPYVLAELPSNLLLKHLKPHVWLAICVFGFGFSTVMTGLTQNYSGILTTRFFLGLFESGIFPGGYYLISMWYRRAEAQKRFTIFFSSNMLAGSFAGLLGYAIGHMDGMRGYHGWRWIFILEGTLTCVIAVALFFLISDFPEEASWLSQDEKDFVKARLEDDVGQSGRGHSFKLSHVIEPLKDYKNYLGAVMYLGLIVPAYSFAYFAPTIIQGYGHSAIDTQLLAIPPYACAFVFGLALSAISDRIRHRFVFVLIGCFIGLAGFILLYVEHKIRSVEYAGLHLAAIGTYTAMPIAVGWFSTNAQGHSERAFATAFQVGVGNCGGIIAAYAFLAKDAPKYLPGYGLCIGFTCLSLLASTAYYVGVSKKVKKQSEIATSESNEKVASHFTYLT